MPAESAPSTPPAWWSTRALGHAALACLVLGAVAVSGAVVQTQFGVFGQREWPLPMASRIKTDGRAYKTRLPGWGHGALAERRAVLLRDGRPVGTRVNHARTVVERGGGAFKIQREHLYFSLPQDEDPRANIRSFSLSLPRPVNPVVWMAGGALLLLGGFGVGRNAHSQTLLATASGKLNATSAVALLSGVFLLALFTTLSRLPDALAYSDGCFSVKGVPYTDAAGWDELATNLASGRGFSGGFTAQRPLYPAMLALLYTVTGQSLLAAKVLNAFWLALAAAAACMLGMAGGSRIAGLAAALAVLIGEDCVSFSKLLLTETSGVAFGVAAVLALAAAIESPRWWRITLAALLLACANLASGFGLFALLGYGAVALFTWWLRQGPKKALVQSLMLAGIVALAWMPWLLRQHAVHGVWNLSTSSANLMYAAASPEHGKLSVEVGGAWQAAGVPNEDGARYKFYMAKYAEAVKAHPAAYARTILRGMETFADYWVFEGPDRFGVMLLGLIAVGVMTLRRERWWAALAACVVVTAVCCTLQGKTAEVMWPLAAVLTLLTCPRQQRPLWALVAVTAPFVAVLAGITGGNLGRRMWTACEWTMPLLVVMGGSGAMRVLAGWLERLSDRLLRNGEANRALLQDTRATGDWSAGFDLSRVSIIPGLVLLAHAVLGSTVVTALHLFDGDASKPAIALTDDDRTKAHQLASARFDFLKGMAANDARLIMQTCTFGEYVCQLDAWEDEQHWARSFEVRPYSRTVAFAQLLQEDRLVACQLRTKPQNLPRNVPLLIIGIQNHDPEAHLGHDTTMVEVLGFAPVEDGTAAWSRVTWLPFTREAFDIVQGKR